MTGFSKLALVEAKLFLREKTARIGVFGLPVALVIGFGLIPGFSDPQKSLSDQIGTEYIAGLGVAIVLASLGLTGCRWSSASTGSAASCAAWASRRSAR
jgi:ABC-2 type transport system permease protein